MNKAFYNKQTFKKIYRSLFIILICGIIYTVYLFFKREESPCALHFVIWGCGWERMEETIYFGIRFYPLWLVTFVTTIILYPTDEIPKTETTNKPVEEKIIQTTNPPQNQNERYPAYIVIIIFLILLIIGYYFNINGTTTNLDTKPFHMLPF